MAVPLPSITLAITPPGGSQSTYEHYLAYNGANQQVTVSQAFGRQGDTAVLPLIEEHSGTPVVRIPVMSQVKLIDNSLGVSGLTLFAGVVNNPALCPDGPIRNEWDLNCTDYTFYADNAIVRGVFNGWTADAIVIALTGQANCGITAASTSQGGFVAPAPVLASFIQNYNTLSTAWRNLASLASQVTPYGWYVDDQRRLHFFDQSTALPSGVTFTTSPTTAGSSTEGHILLDSQFLYEWDGTSIRNRVMVQGASQVFTNPYSRTAPASPTDTWQANGTDQAWAMRYVVSGSPTLFVGGVSVSVTVVTAGSAVPAGTAWSVQQNSVGQYFLIAATAPGAGTTIKIWYDYSVPIVMQANDATSQATYTGPNGGVFTEYISDTSLTTAPMALARAQQDRQEYAFAPERITFDTAETWTGWIRAGQTCTVNCAFIPDSQRGWAWGVNDTFLVTANRVTFGSGGYRQCQVTAVRL